MSLNSKVYSMRFGSSSVSNNNLNYSLFLKQSFRFQKTWNLANKSWTTFIMLYFFSLFYSLTAWVHWFTFIGWRSAHLLHFSSFVFHRGKCQRGLEWHENEKIITGSSFLGELFYNNYIGIVIINPGLC